VVAATCAAPGTVVANTSGSSTVYNCVVPSASAAACSAPGVFDSSASPSTCTTEIQNACTGTMAAKVGATTDTRTIYTANNAGNALIAFDAAYATANPANFAAAHINTLNQWSTLSGTQQTAAAGVNLINYLRGQNGFEIRAANVAANWLYRARETVLGDALESQPAFISKPVFSYPYTGYSDYAIAQSGRVGTVYMGTNDGMMHAFAASDGTERWAYVPSMVIPNMWKLASTSYSGAHVNFVNGSPITTDIYCPANCGGAANGAASASWRTILVAGLNGGGRGYYALDITVPGTPTLMWEFTPTTGNGAVKDDAVGYSYGLPVVTRKTDGTWVVMVTSGYNNTSPGDGKGYLFVLNANTGAIISKISTGVGDTTTPSGLARIAGWNNEPVGNAVGFTYGGDLLGNVWRFDINSPTAATIGTGAVMKFATLYSDGTTANTAGTSPQPITTTPVLGKILGKRVIFIGTGKYLEAGDLTTTQKQTQYAIKDDDETTTLVNPRTTLVNPTLSNNPDLTATRIAAPDASGKKVDFLAGRGWYVDFPDGGSGGVGAERVNIDSKLIEGTLLVPTIVPSSTVCSPGGYGWLNFFDYKTGNAVIPGNTGTGLASVKYDSTIVGVNLIYIGGNPKVEVVTSTNPTPELDKKAAFIGVVGLFQGKRVTWRELIP
jgi:type IV pilus assembly protein PilY1